MSLTFKSWRRSPLYDLAPNENLTHGRLVGRLNLTLNDLFTGESAAGSVDFQITTPADVAGLLPREILRTAPPAAAGNAETTKLVHIDFAAPDMPWRYTPRKAAADKLFPWLAILVGTTSELKIERTGLTVTQPSVFSDHDLSQSAFWAHVQDDGATKSSRLLSPRRLLPQTAYIAALVSAFDEDGLPAWDPAAGRTPTTLSLFYSWEFWTGEEGDFETLATAIQLREVGNLGRAPLAYRRGAVDSALYVRGAITSLGDDKDGAPEAAARADLAAFRNAVKALSALDPLGRSVIGMPDHGRPWIADVEAGTWTQSVNTDPRYRGTAGLGLWMGIEYQQALLDAAVAQLGAAPMAVKLVGNLAAGILGSRSLWERRLPAESSRQVYLFSPLMRRLRTPSGNALDTITSDVSPLERALFSTAARRMLRRGTAATRHSQNGFIGREELIEAANVCPPARPRTLPGLPHVESFAVGVGLVPIEGPEGLGLRPRVLTRWEARHRPANRHRIDVDIQQLRNDLLQQMPSAPPDRCKAPNLDAVAATVRGAIDPHLANAPAIRRVAARISGLDISRLGPPEVEVGLDFPTWTLLRDLARDWLVPGITLLEKHSVVALQTNPQFNDAYLLGINSQFINELHWRRLPIDRRSTPLKMFWGHINYETGVREAEIKPFPTWPVASELGDVSHQVLKPGDATGQRDLIILFRSDLFRRYPSTLVYLVRTPAAPAALDAALKATPDFHYTSAERNTRQFLGPTFQGAIASDLVFFAFDIDPDTIDQYWLILDEPPSELRFRGVNDADAPLAGTAPRAGDVPARAPDAHAAQFATRLIDEHSRVAISGATLKARA
jgi:hypothetical protein